MVGGGQAGLAIGYYLAQQGAATILEAAPSRRRRGVTVGLAQAVHAGARYDSLPGLAFPGDPDRYPGRDEVAAYLTDYARHFELPVELDSRVRSVRASGGRYLLEVDDRTYDAGQVVIATGPFQVPFVPPLAGGLAGGVVQLHSSDYRSPVTSLGRVLVVGGGNTGFQIAEELAAAQEVHLSIGRARRRCPSASWVATCSGISTPPA